MPASASVLAAATTLVEWAHQRRRHWTDQPLHVEPRAQKALEVHEVHEVLQSPAMLTEHEPAQEFAPLPQFAEAFQVSEVLEVLEVLEVPEVQEVHELYEVPEVPELPPFLEIPQAAEVPMHFEPAHVEPLVESRNLFQFGATRASVSEPDADLAERAASIGFGGRVLDVLRAGGSLTLTAGGFALKGAARVGEFASDAIEGVGPLGDVALWCLTRGAALVSTASVLMLLTLNRADLFSRWNRLTETVAAAAAATRPQPPPPIVFPAGSGRLIITSSEDKPQVIVDGKAFGPAPVTLFLSAGPHRLLVRGPKGSVERTVHVDAGETAELNEEIYPGWVAVASAVDLTFTENGRTLKRDERGWAILPPGPHDIHLDNNVLGIHETRHVVVTPGDATRISLAPPASTLSIAANEPAEVWVDGTSLGEAPIVDAPMKLGMHDVRVRSASHERWLRVRVTTQPSELNVDLTAE